MTIKQLLQLLIFSCAMSFIITSGVIDARDYKQGVALRAQADAAISAIDETSERFGN